MYPDDSLAQAYAEELPWLAFLYVSEELTPDEVVDFEERMLTDQAAREAVAEAMKLADGIWLASALDTYGARPEAVPVSPAIHSDRADHRKVRRWALWIGSTLAAAVVAFCVGWWFAGGYNDGTPLADQSRSESAPELLAEVSPVEGAEELVGLWTDSRELLAVLGPSSEFPSELVDDYQSQDSGDSEEEAFAWMLAAVSAGSGEVQDNTPKVMEN
jgi:hypothetical protein